MTNEQLQQGKEIEKEIKSLKEYILPLYKFFDNVCKEDTVTKSIILKYFDTIEKNGSILAQKIALFF